MVFERSEKPTCAPPVSLRRFARIALKQAKCRRDRQWPFVVLLSKTPDRRLFRRFLQRNVPRLCLHVVPRDPQHFRSSQTRATCAGCFAHYAPIHKHKWIWKWSNKCHCAPQLKQFFLSAHVFFFFLRTWVALYFTMAQKLCLNADNITFVPRKPTKEEAVLIKKKMAAQAFVTILVLLSCVAGKLMAVIRQIHCAL